MSTEWLVLKTAAHVLVCVPALIALVFITLLIITSKLPFSFVFRHALALSLWAVLVTISVTAWQYSAKETGWWPIALGGTILEIVLGIWMYCSAVKEKRQGNDSKVMFNYIVYFALITGCVVGGVFAWSIGMKLIAGNVSVVGLAVIGVILLTLSLLVGYFSFAYIEGVAKPLLLLSSHASTIFDIYRGAASKICERLGEGHTKVEYHIRELYRTYPPANIFKACFDYYSIFNTDPNTPASTSPWIQAITAIDPTDRLQAQKECRNILVDNYFDKDEYTPTYNGNNTPTLPTLPISLKKEVKII